MFIEKIVKKDNKNVTLIFDNGEKLYLSYDIFIKNGLRNGEDISESRFSFLIDENQKFYLKQKAFRYLGRRQHSAFELKLKLKQKGYDVNNIDVVISQLLESNYLNDYDFAKTFSEEKIKNKSWGRRKIEAELIKKGVARDIIAQIINEEFSNEDQIDRAINLCKKKLKSLITRKTEEEKIYTKLISFLLTKGYDYETSKLAVEKVLNGRE